MGGRLPLYAVVARCVAVLLILSTAGCRSVAGTLDEVGELFVEGGERVLKEPMRPATDGPRVLVIALDGVGEDRLAEALAAGDLPSLSALVGADRGDGLYDHGVLVRSVPSVFPSETAAGWAAVYTGERPAVTGVTGNEWFDRDSLQTFAPVPLSVGTLEQTLAIWSDSLFSAVIQAPTLFERADRRAHVSLGFVYRGADLLTPPDLNDVGDLLGAAIGAVFGGVEEAYEAIDEDTVEGVERGVERYGLPDLQVAYFPGVDLVAHASGAQAQKDYLRDEIDRQIDAVLDVYRERGALASTTVVVVSDHGHGDTLADDRHSLDAGGRDEPPALLDSLGYRLRDFTVAADSSDANVVMIYDEAVTMLYLANGATCAPGTPCDWTARPRLRDDVLPLARALRAASDADTTAVGGFVGHARPHLRPCLRPVRPHLAALPRAPRRPRGPGRRLSPRHAASGLGPPGRAAGLAHRRAARPPGRGHLAPDAVRGGAARRGPVLFWVAPAVGARRRLAGPVVHLAAGGPCRRERGRAPRDRPPVGRRRTEPAGRDPAHPASVGRTFPLTPCACSCPCSSSSPPAKGRPSRPPT